MKKHIALLLVLLMFAAGCQAPTATPAASPSTQSTPFPSAAPSQTAAPTVQPSPEPSAEPSAPPASVPNVYEEVALSVTDPLVKFLAPVGKAMVLYDYDLLCPEFVWQVLLDLAEDRLHAEENGVSYYQINFSTLIEKESAEQFVCRYFSLDHPSPIDESNPLVREGLIALKENTIELIQPQTDPIYSVQIARVQQNADGDLLVYFNVMASYASGKGEVCGYAQALLKKDAAAYFGYTLQDADWISRDPMPGTASDEQQTLFALLAAASCDSGLALNQAADPLFAFHLLWRTWQSGHIPAEYLENGNRISAADLQTVLESLLWVTQFPTLPEGFTRITYDAASDQYIFHEDATDSFSVTDILITKEENMPTYNMQVNRHLGDGSQELVGRARARVQTLKHALFENLGIEFQLY